MILLALLIPTPALAIKYCQTDFDCEFFNSGSWCWYQLDKLRHPIYNKMKVCYYSHEVAKKKKVDPKKK